MMDKLYTHFDGMKSMKFSMTKSFLQIHCWSIWENIVSDKENKSVDKKTSRALDSRCI